MSDIRTVLHQAASTPSQPPNMHAIRERARRLGHRRVFVWLTGAVAVLGVGFPVGNTILVSPGSSDRISTIDADVPRPSRQDEAAVGAASGGDTRSGDKSAAASSSPAAHVSPATTVPAVGGIPTTTTAPTGHPARESCRIDNNGLLPGESRRCQFTATRAGGWRFSDGAGAGADWSRGIVTVTRDGETKTYNSVGFTSCGDTVIEPGDLVTLEFVQGTQDVTVGGYVAAGYRWSCTERG